MRLDSRRGIRDRSRRCHEADPCQQRCAEQTVTGIVHPYSLTLPLRQGVLDTDEATLKER